MRDATPHRIARVWRAALTLCLGTMGCGVMGASAMACGPAPIQPHPVAPSPSPKTPAPAPSSALSPPPLPPQPALPAPDLPQLPSLRSGKLASGARYHLVERKSGLASLILQLDAGTLHGRTGVARLTAAAVARGSASRDASSSPLEAEKQLARLGGALRVAVSSEHTRFTLEVPQSQLSAAIDALAGLMARPMLAGQRFPTTRTHQTTLAHTLASEGERALMQDALRQLLLGGGDAGVVSRAAGTARELGALPFSACDTFYQAYYGAERATLVVVGAAPKRTEKRVRTALGRLRSANGGKTHALPAPEGAPPRIYVVDVPSTERARLWLASPLSTQERGWPAGPLAREQLVETATLQLASLPNATVEHAELLPWQRGGAITLLARVPHQHAASAARLLQRAALQRSLQPHPGMLSATRVRVAGALSRQLSSATGTAHWLLQRQLGLGPRDQAQLATLLHATPAPTQAQPPVMLVVGTARTLAPTLTGLGEVLVLDPHDGFAVTQAHMPDFEVIHAEPPEQPPSERARP